MSNIYMSRGASQFEIVDNFLDIIIIKVIRLFDFIFMITTYIYLSFYY